MTPSALETRPPLPREFFLRPAQEVAADLIGKVLFVAHPGEKLAAQIVEVEAYLGAKDPASHAYRGLTKRNWPMFEEGGTCYVYLSYGMHLCMNVSTGPKGMAEAVLFRAVVPLLGVDRMAERRGVSASEPRRIGSGPGKLTRALGVDRAYNGLRFDRPDFKLVDQGNEIAISGVGTSPRIGISRAKDDPLRFFLKGSPWLSRRE